MATSSSSTISSLGVGSGLDANTIVQKLMAIEKQPLTALDNKAASYTAKLSSFGQLKSALSALQTSAGTWADPAKLAAFTATSDDKDVLGASATFNASAGTYNVTVSQLATAQKRFTNNYANSTVFGAGSLSVTVNGTTKTVTLANASNTLQDVRSAINDAAVGVTASVVTGTSGSRLVLTSSQTGTSGAFSMSVNSTNANLQSLATFDLTQAYNTNAQDASFSVEGIAGTSSSNAVTTAVNGITLNLQAVGSTSVTVSRDNSHITSAVNDFVTNYNAVIAKIKTDSDYDPTTGTGKPLNSEATVRSIQNMLGSARTTVPSDLSAAKYKYLSDLGITLKADGTMTLNSSKLDAAVQSSASDVYKTLQSYGSAFSTAIEKMTNTGSSGIIQTRLDGIKKAQTTLEKNRAALELRISAIEKQYRAQFTALDTTVSKLTTIGTYLTQQLSSN